MKIHRSTPTSAALVLLTLVPLGACFEPWGPSGDDTGGEAAPEPEGEGAGGAPSDRDPTTGDGGEDGDFGGLGGHPGTHDGGAAPMGGSDAGPEGGADAAGGSGAGGSLEPPDGVHFVSVTPLQQTSFAGTSVDWAPVFELHDAQGQPLPGSMVEVELTGGGTFEHTGGSFSSTGTFMTDGAGRVSLDDWTLGKLAGDYALHVTSLEEADVEPLDYTATAGSDFEIRVEFVNPVTEAQRDVFEKAVARWRGAIVGALEPLTVSLDAIAAPCGVTAPQSGTITTNGVVIFAEIGPIDGPGQILGSAGPCLVRTGDGSPLTGVMRFDSDDLLAMQHGGSLEPVILHEMGHVLGIGTLWGYAGLLQNPSVPDAAGADTHHTGVHARAAFDALGGWTFTGTKVPVENSGIPGSGDGHWRETVADRELMTPYLNGVAEGVPLSALTIASLEDFGYYATNAQAADAFSLAAASLSAGPAPTAHVACEVLRPRAATVPAGTMPAFP